MLRSVRLRVALLLMLSPLAAHADLTYPPILKGDAGAPESALVRAGYLDVTLYGADSTGKTDSTKAIQAAINDAMNYAMVTYLPVGTYLVSAPLVGEQVYTSECYSSTYWGKNSVWQAPTLVGPASGPRPIIHLADSSPAFQDASNPVAIIHFYNNGSSANAPAWSGNTSCEMFSVIRDLNVEVGNGNPGAVGVENPGSQGCYLENIHVDATNAYAGIMGTPGVAELAVNLEVVGGQYGIIPYWPTTLVGVTVRNQTVAGLKLDNFDSLAVVGFEVEEPVGTAAIINTTYTSQRSQIALVDGTITITGAAAGVAIQNQNGHDLYMENVFVSTTGSILQNGTSTPVPASGATSQVSQYAFTNPTQDDEQGEIENSTTFINGVASQKEVRVIGSAESTPGDLVLRHLPGQLPSMDDPGVIDVTTLGADPTSTTDSTMAIQKAIDMGEEVFLPRGMYLISSTLTLKPNTRLFGVPGNYSQLLAAPSWDPGGQYVPFIQTANTATGATYVGDLFIEMPNATLAQSYISALDWQAGRSSTVRQVYPRLPWKSCPTGGCFVEPPRDVVHVEKSGGGRWYGLQLSQIDPTNFDPQMREVLVDKTTAPATFYAPNPEHTSGPMFEISGASNVRILGTKVEGQYGLMSGSTNVEVTAYAGHNTAGPGEAEWTVDNSTNVIIAASSDYAGGLGTSPAGYLIFEQNDGGTEGGIRDNDNCSLFAEGAFDAAVFPHCGDGTCDGAETVANCPTDCAGPASNDGGIDAGSPHSDKVDAAASVGPSPVNRTSDASASPEGSPNDDAGSAGGCAFVPTRSRGDAYQYGAFTLIVVGPASFRRRVRRSR